MSFLSASFIFSNIILAFYEDTELNWWNSANVVVQGLPPVMPVHLDGDILFVLQVPAEF